MRAMILAAGYGTRLNPLTLDRPKPLMEVLGTPIIEMQLQSLRKWGVSHAMLNTHHLGDQLQKRLGSQFAGIKLSYSPEPLILGTGGGLKQAEDFFAGESAFLLLHGDVLIDLDFASLMQFHKRYQPVSTMVLKEVSDFQGTRPVGTDFYNRVSRFLGISTETPTVKERMFCGVHALSPSVLSHLPLNSNYCITADAYPKLVAQGENIMGFNFDGFFCDIGTLDQYYALNMGLLAGDIKLKKINLFSRYNRLGPLLPDGSPQYKKTIWMGDNVKINMRQVTPPCIIDDNTIIDEQVKIGPFAIIGRDCVIEGESTLSNSIVQSGTRINNQVLEREMRSRNHSASIGLKQDC